MTTNVPLGATDKFISAVSHLARVIDERATADPNSSYTALLLNDGIESVTKKWIEESQELSEAICSTDKNAIAHETADVLFHILVALRHSNVSLDDVATKLIDRQSQSGLEEKRNRTS